MCVLVVFFHRGLGWCRLSFGPRSVLAVMEVNLQRNLHGGCFSPSPFPYPTCPRCPPGLFSHVQLCSVLLATLELHRTWPGASAEDVHGTIFLLVEKVLLSHLSWEPWGCKDAKKRSEAGKPLCLCWSSSRGLPYPVGVICRNQNIVLGCRALVSL